MNKDIKINLMMKQLLDISDNTIKFTFKEQNLNKLFSPRFVINYDCIIIADDNKDLLPKHEFLKNVEEMYTDKTGYEASITDTLINYYIEEEDVKLQDILPVAFTVIDVWSSQLKMIDSLSKFCFIVTCESDYNHVTIRFHKLRDNEPMWIDSNLEQYEEPVGYVII